MQAAVKSAGDIWAELPLGPRMEFGRFLKQKDLGQKETKETMKESKSEKSSPRCAIFSWIGTGSTDQELNRREQRKKRVGLRLRRAQSSRCRSAPISAFLIPPPFPLFAPLSLSVRVTPAIRGPGFAGIGRGTGTQSKRDSITQPRAKGFTVLELLVVVAVISILAALLLPALGRAKAKAQQPVCMDNLRQIGLAIRMYAEDSSDAFPPATNHPPASFTAYTQLMKSYVGLTGAKSERAKLFACPADTFYWDYDNGWISQSLSQQPRYYYSSYGFNGGNFLSGKPPVPRWPGIAGRKLSSIREPVKTVLDTEFAALLPYSWHEPIKVSHYNNARDMVGFVDGHASFIKMYWNADKTNGIEAWHYDPPAAYDYKWSGD